MEKLWWEIFVWLALAFISSVTAFITNISASLIELIVGIIAGNTIKPPITDWVSFLATFGAVILTFLAGAELESEVVRRYWKESIFIGFMGFLAPFILVSLISYFLLNWNLKQALISGIALSTTSVAVVYAVMIESGLNETNLGKVILAACFVNDLGTVIALGLIFTKFNLWFYISSILMIILIAITPFISSAFFKWVKNHPSEPEVKFIFFIVSLLGLLAVKGHLEAVLPAYIIGAVLANQFMKNKELVRRMRATTISILTPFYFLKAGSLVDLKIVISSIILVITFSLSKVIAKFLGIFPLGYLFRFTPRINAYTTLMMSTGLTFGTISALFGLQNGIINKEQYSILVVSVILTAIIPTMIANSFFKPIYRHEKALRRFKIRR
jgi:Kef-type K+ transport system membrane component KefB